ncbi:hypothetical protein PHSY_002902 [Pseudozyma hubeiensis SY62]|uniref:Uncharacterized protein n=1 Tax=Pseudozyma hubeiensis (strain SY62) TaxID=1305764 RepID=R9P2C2_PSEHS|nr:hypothetical protein PHSY_002902 [Pseudozyma hubeiensis SY62]GAC95327.1 hypothetical protein PHSY_002902 [Pseudozyma hubeiensis SY62]
MGPFQGKVRLRHLLAIASDVSLRKRYQGFRTSSELVALIPLHVRNSSGFRNFRTRSSRSIAVVPSPVLLTMNLKALANRTASFRIHSGDRSSHRQT